MPLIDLPPQGLWFPQRPAIVRTDRGIEEPRVLQAIIPGLMPGPGHFAPTTAAGPVALTFEDEANTDNKLTTYDFGTLQFGTAASDRVVIVGVAANQDQTNRTLNSVSIGGVNGSFIAGATNIISNNMSITDFYGRLVPAGTSGNVTITFNGQMARAGVVVYSMTGSGGLFTAHDSDPHENGTNTATPSGTINIPANGAALALSHQNRTSGSFSWTNLVEDHDGFLGVTRKGSASEEFTAEQINRTITATFSNGANRTGFNIVSFGPG